jgi:hypothetical protein
MKARLTLELLGPFPTAVEVGKCLGVHYSTVCALAHKGELEFIRTN